MESLENKAREGKINENASVRDRQSIIINAKIDDVWTVLTDINHWHEWYTDIKSARADHVKDGASFDWQIRHTHFQSTFQKVDKPVLLTWVGKSKLVKSIFVWSLEASDTQTIVTVEESLEGFVIPGFNNASKLHDILIEWLKSLKIKAESH